MAVQATLETFSHSSNRARYFPPASVHAFSIAALSTGFGAGVAVGAAGEAHAPTSFQLNDADELISIVHRRPLNFYVMRVERIVR
jgi:hypothetical protein